MNKTFSVITAAMLCLSMTGCAAQIRQACADLGLVPGTSDFAQCYLMKEQMIVNAINQASANISNSMPKTYYVNENINGNIWYHRY